MTYIQLTDYILLMYDAALNVTLLV